MPGGFGQLPGNLVGDRRLDQAQRVRRLSGPKREAEKPGVFLWVSRSESHASSLLSVKKKKSSGTCSWGSKGNQHEKPGPLKAPISFQVDAQFPLDVIYKLLFRVAHFL